MSNNDRISLPDPLSAPELFEGVLTRRILAFLVDCALLVALASIIGIVGVIAGFFTFGLGWAALPIIIPIATLGYYVVTLGSPMRATIGMSMFDIVLTPARGRPLDGLAILIHPIVFWITVWVAWPISLLVALLTPRRQMVQDLVTGTLMLRRSPMVRHWSSMRA